LDVLYILAAAFPASFFIYERRRLPLALGIRYDAAAALAARGIDVSASEIGRSVTFYTSAEGYFRKLVVGAVRIDLNGNPAGLVTADEAERAWMRLGVLLDRRQKEKEKGGGS
jgi:ProP effector